MHAQREYWERVQVRVRVGERVQVRVRVTVMCMRNGGIGRECR